MNKVKRIGNVLLILIGVVLIVVCADLISNKLGKTSLHQLDEVDRGAIEEICAMTALFDERYGSDEIWNESYDLRRCPCVLTRSFGFVKGYTYIVNMDYNKSIFSQKIKMPSEYEGISVYRLSYLTPMTFSLIKEEDGSFPPPERKQRTVPVSPVSLRLPRSGPGSHPPIRSSSPAM